ncbi:MAG: hypothetical protein FRX49_08812 [Trebouxia sp. A1-2]|nr:MAG: hypothetical protein FRX49_08812 [Trebouxia sp. A1-2]
MTVIIVAYSASVVQKTRSAVLLEELLLNGGRKREGGGTVLGLKDSAGAAEEAQEHQLCLLQPRRYNNKEMYRP